jgi:hypothetical protein
MKPIHLNRLKRLANHLRRGKLGHKKFNQGLSVVASDIMLCRPDLLRRLTLAIPKQVRITRTYFENNPETCEINAVRRGNANIRFEIEKIRELTQTYRPPQRPKPLPVAQAPWPN